jgi:hypothetical protein
MNVRGGMFMGFRAPVHNSDLMSSFQKTDGKLCPNKTEAAGNKNLHAYLPTAESLSARWGFEIARSLILEIVYKIRPNCID